VHFEFQQVFPKCTLQPDIISVVDFPCDKRIGYHVGEKRRQICAITKRQPATDTIRGQILKTRNAIISEFSVRSPDFQQIHCGECLFEKPLLRNDPSSRYSREIAKSTAVGEYHSAICPEIECN